LAGRDVAFACADFERRIAQLDSNGVPAPVAVSRAGIAEVVLLAQLVGNAVHGRIEIPRVAHNLRASAAVVGDLAQRDDVHPVVRIAGEDSAAASAAAGITRLWRWHAAATSAAREWKRNRNARRLLNGRRRPRTERWFGIAVDADRVDEHFGFADDALHFG